MAAPPLRRLLIVEDREATRLALALQFRRRGWEVQEAPTLRRALQALASGPPDAILLDLDLPDGRGEAVLLVARAYDPSCRVVVLTACEDRTRLRALLDLEPDAVLREGAAVDEVAWALGCDAPRC